MSQIELQEKIRASRLWTCGDDFTAADVAQVVRPNRRDYYTTAQATAALREMVKKGELKKTINGYRLQPSRFKALLQRALWNRNLRLDLLP